MFPEQVTTDQVTQNLLYWLSAGGVLVAIAGLLLVDLGLVARRNALETCIQKIVGCFIATAAYLVVGFGVWNWQFYSAFGVPSPLKQAVSDWWIGGVGLTTFAQDLDPASFAGATNSQIFAVFLAIYAGFVCVLIHFGGSERLKPGAYYVMCAGIGGVVYPLLLWLTWGSTSPLTNLGVHDFVGVFVGYVFAGTFGLMLAWRLGPRAGLFRPRRDGSSWAPANMALAAVGVALLLVAIPLVAVGCGYVVPKVGYVGVAMSTSGIGIVIANVYAAFCGGTLMGALLSYRTRNPLHVLLGPLAGYLTGTGGFDVLLPWQAFLLAACGPLAVAAVVALLHRRGIDESKIVPLGLGAGLVGALAIGFIAWGTKTGGYLGIEEGSFAFQHAEITPWWQLVGVAVAMGAAVVAGLVLIVGVEKTIGIRVDEADEDAGLDATLWGFPSAEAGTGAVR